MVLAQRRGVRRLLRVRKPHGENIDRGHEPFKDDFKAQHDFRAVRNAGAVVDVVVVEYDGHPFHGDDVNAMLAGHGQLQPRRCGHVAQEGRFAADEVIRKVHEDGEQRRLVLARDPRPVAVVGEAAVPAVAHHFDDRVDARGPPHAAGAEAQRHAVVRLGAGEVRHEALEQASSQRRAVEQRPVAVARALHVLGFDGGHKRLRRRDQPVALVAHQKVRDAEHDVP
mmetsp:Transcript_24946/g.77103  ORF Transcript_24946/g.77103 Transcript_24946/m.77103 type:complete len:225 (+) Transcript_24946:969-1643(+)